jgi:ankyrin repeat protein
MVLANFLKFRSICSWGSVFAHVVLPFCVGLAGCRDEKDPQSIHKAAHVGDSEAVSKFIAGDVDVNERDHKGLSILHLGSRRGHKEIVLQALDAGAKIDARGDNANRTALHLAARNGHSDIVKLLLERGADANAKDIRGLTPLHLANEGGVEVAAALLDKGADPNAENESGETPLHWAAYSKRAEAHDVFKLLLDRGAIVKVDAELDPAIFEPAGTPDLAELLDAVTDKEDENARKNPPRRWVEHQDQ